MKRNFLPKVSALAIRRVVLLLVFAMAILASLGMSSVAFADNTQTTWTTSENIIGPSCPPGQIAEGGQLGGQWVCSPVAQGEGG